MLISCRDCNCWVPAGHKVAGLFFPPLFPSPARNGRHQRDLIAFGEFVILIQKTDVLIIHVDIQKPSHLALLIAPQFEAIVSRRRWRATLGVLAATVLFIVVGAMTVRNSVTHPVPSMLDYAADAEAHDAWLVTPAALDKPGSWSAGALGASRQLMTPRQHLAASGPPSWLTNVFGEEILVAVRPAPRVPLTGPVATVIADSTTDAGRRLTLRIVSAPGTLNVEMRSIDGTVLAAAVDGRAIDTTRYRRRTRQWTLSYAAPPDSGFTLALTMPRGARIALELSAQSAGIAPLTGLRIPPRPDDVVPVQSGDQTDIYRRVTF